MDNHITLEGTVTDDPQSLYAPSGALTAILSLRVPLPDSSPPTYWALLYDIREQQTFNSGSDTFLVVCRDILAEACLIKWKTGDLVRVEGRLVITEMRTPTIYGGEEIVPLTEVLANSITSLA